MLLKYVSRRSQVNYLALLPNITITIKDNICSTTIDIVDVMFHALLEHSIAYHGCLSDVVNRGHQGIQLKFPYISPTDSAPYGTISLTFYATTSRLLVQGSSYILWIEEHLPHIYSLAQSDFMDNASKWITQARKQGVGKNRGCTVGERIIITHPDSPISPTTSPAKLPALPVVEGSVNTSEYVTLHDKPTLPVTQMPAADTTYDDVIDDEPEVLGLNRSFGQTAEVMLVDTEAVSHRDSNVASPLLNTQVKASAIPAHGRLPRDLSVLEDERIRPNPVISVNGKTVVAGPQDKVSPDAHIDLGRNKPSHKSSIPDKPTHKIKKKTRKSNKKSNPSNTEYCLPDCSFNSSMSCSWMRCILCMRWHHNLCVGESEGYAGAWSCPNCRLVPEMLTQLQAQLGNLTDSLRGTLDREQSLKQKLHNQTTMDTTILSLRAENNRLVQKIASLEANRANMEKLMDTMCATSVATPLDAPIAFTEPVSSFTSAAKSASAHVIPNVSIYNPYELLDTITDDDYMPLPTRRVSSTKPSRKHSGKCEGRESSSNDTNTLGPEIPSSPVNPPLLTSHSLQFPASPRVRGGQRVNGVSSDRQPTLQDATSDDAADNLQPTSVIVVGSSIVKGMASLVHGNGREFDASGFSYPGCTAKQINGSFRNIPECDVTVVQAGTNNIEGQSVKQVTTELSQLIDNVSRKRLDKRVIMCHIPHRHDKKRYLNSKIDKVNDFIDKTVQKHKNWRILKHDYATADLQRDGLHFNERGSATFALEIRHIVRNFPYVSR